MAEGEVAGIKSEVEDVVDSTQDIAPEFLMLDESTTTDALTFIKKQIAHLSLLSKRDEQSLAQALADAAKSIAILQLETRQSAAELCSILDVVLKKHISLNQPVYAPLKREVGDLAKHSVALEKIVKHLRRAMQSMAKLSTQVELTELISSVSWPGPLMVAMANRHANEEHSDTSLVRALDTFFEACDIEKQRDDYQLDVWRNKLAESATEYTQKRNKLVEHNIRLVFHIAKRYAKKNEHLPELIQEGSIGLIRAAEKYQASSGHRFSTYAYYWIDSKVRKARVNIDKVIPIALDKSNDIAQVAQKIDLYKHADKRVTTRDLAEDTGLPLERVELVRSLNHQHISLDGPTGESDDSTMHSKIADEKSSFLNKIAEQNASDVIDVHMQVSLTDREAYVVNQRFGRLSGEESTLQEISHSLDISRERVRQLEIAAVAKMRRQMSDDDFLSGL